MITTRTSSLRVVFCFSSTGIGGAEKSMLRLMVHAQGGPLDSFIIAPLAADMGLIQEAKSAAISVIQLNSKSAWSYYKTFRDIKPDVVYFFGRFRTIAWILAAKLARVPCLIGAERSSAASFKDWVSRTLDKPLLDGYIANSRVAAHNLNQRLGIDKNRIFVVHNGVAIQGRSRERCEARVQQSHTNIVCVANILPNKGQLLLLEAAGVLRSEFPNLKVTLVGSDHSNGKFEQRARELGLADLLRMEGFQPEVGKYLLEATVFVLPSRAREGMPTSVLEAMAAGAPVIASNVGGVAELVEHGVTGLLFEAEDLGSLTENLRLALSNENMRVKLAENAIRAAATSYSIKAMVDGHVRVFKTLKDQAR